MSGSTPREKLLAPALARIETQIRQALCADEPVVHQLLLHAAAGKGKRIRARLTLLSARVAGTAGRQAEQLAVAMELFHQATLVHDDVIDASAQRRHRPTLNQRFGNQAAVLAGDLIFVQAVNLLLHGLPESVTRIVAAAAGEVCRGEIEELKSGQDEGLTFARYLDLIGKKTASLTAACCESGAVLAGATARQAATLAQFGRAFGMAFQIQDDVLDIAGEPKRLGKPVGEDIQQGHLTLPLILGLRSGTAGERRTLLQVFRGQNADPKKLRLILTQSGALAKARAIAQEYVRRAQRALEKFPASTARAALQALAETAVAREK